MAVLVGGSLCAQAVRVYSPEAVPEAIRNALSINGYTAENQITSDLKGVSQGSAILKIEIETKNRFVLYAEKTHFELAPDFQKDWKIVDVKVPESMTFIDPITKTIKRGYSGQKVFELKVALQNKLPAPPPLDFNFLVHATLQACNKEVCLLPATLELTLPLRRSTLASDDENVERSFVEKLSDRLQETLSGGAWGLGVFEILFLAGLLTAFTPCVYPLYPITIGIFLNWGRLGIRPWLLGLVYCAGSVFSYSLLGVLAVLSGRVFGSLTQTPFFQIGIGAILLLSAVFYAGILEFPIPERLRAFFSKSSNPENVSPAKKMAEAFAMGFGLGIVASPCVGPVLVALLAWMSHYLNQGGSWIQGLGLFAVFGMGLMTPFLILSILVGRGSKTPRLGAWAQRAKWVGSLLMVAGSLFFLIPGLKALSMARPGAKKFAFSILPATQPLPNNLRPTVMDFRADWCVSCLELEGETFQDAKVAEEFHEHWNFVKVDLSTTGGPEEKIAEEKGVVGLPTLLFLNPQGQVCEPFTLTGFENSEKFLARLLNARAKCL
jgi:thiol:disulfide interchange protein DsbD